MDALLEESNAHESWLSGESLPPNVNKSASKSANLCEVPQRCFHNNEIFTMKVLAVNLLLNYLCIRKKHFSQYIQIVFYNITVNI